VSVSAQAQQLRHAVTECIESGPVIVGCSGGPDSLALADAAAWAVPHMGGTLTVVVVDHGLQPDSAAVAERAADACRAIGINDVEIRRVQVGRKVAPRQPRVLPVAGRCLTWRKSGAPSRSCWPTRSTIRPRPCCCAWRAAPVRARLRRCSPAMGLGIDRSWIYRDTRAQVARERFEPLGFTPWDDPHNHDSRFARVRVRKSLALLETELGPGLTANLARSAKLLGDDADALDAWALGDFARIVDAEKSSCSADITALAELPRAVRTRLLRLMHQHIVGVHEDLSFDHIQQVEAMVSRWKGQGPTSLPGEVTAAVEYGRLTLLVQPREM
jgi:tRNA(Ile)-lysidine synthase